MPREELDELKVRDRLAGRVGVERVPERIPAVAPNRRLDPSAARARASDDEREIVALELTAAHERLQPAMRLLRARHDHQAGRVAVEPVDDPGPLGVATGDLVREQSV